MERLVKAVALLVFAGSVAAAVLLVPGHPAGCGGAHATPAACDPYFDDEFRRRTLIVLTGLVVAITLPVFAKRFQRRRRRARPHGAAN